MSARRPTITPSIHPLEPRTLLAVIFDPTFGDNGRITGALGDNGGFANNIAFVQTLADGKTIIGGGVGFNGDVRLARYTAAGRLDTTFNGDGFSDDAQLPSAGYTDSGVVAPDGKIVVGCFIDDRVMVVSGGDTEPFAHVDMAERNTGFGLQKLGGVSRQRCGKREVKRASPRPPPSRKARQSRRLRTSN
jgi:hypothetical protein